MKVSQIVSYIVIPRALKPYIDLDSVHVSQQHSNVKYLSFNLGHQQRNIACDRPPSVAAAAGTELLAMHRYHHYVQ
jgi:hypothetical protein